MLPEGGLTLDSFADLKLPKKAGTKKYYDLLEQECKDNPSPSLQSILDQMDGDSQYDHKTWEEFEDLTEAEEDAEQAAKDQADAIAEIDRQFDELVASIRSVIDDTFSVRQAFDNVSEATRNFVEKAEELVAGGHDLAEVFAADTAKGKELRDEVDALAGTIPELIATMLESQDPAEDIAEAFVNQKDILRDLLTAYGLGPAAIEEYINALNLIPEEVGTTIRFNIDMMELYGVSGVAASQLAGIIADTGIGNIGGFHGGAGSFAGFNTGEIQIPGLANGGIVRKPTLAMIGESGPEAVVPLGQMGGDTTVVNVTVQGSVLSEMDLTDVIQAQLIRTKNRNASLEFA